VKDEKKQKDTAQTAGRGSELFIVDNSEKDWKVLRYLRDWCGLSKTVDIATGYFEIGALLGLEDEWQKVDHIRILMGAEVSLRTKAAFEEGLKSATDALDASIEAEKFQNDFLAGVPAIVEAIRSRKIECRVYRERKFHAKAIITHGRLEVVGAFALVGSSNLTLPGLTENVELNVQIAGRPVAALQEWYEAHWNAAEDVTPEILRTIERHTREYSPFEVYARALHEFFRREEMTDREWLESESKVWPVLDQYQKDGFHQLIKIADRYGGAFLCDGVGLGKTFVGLMLLEYLVERLRKRVALLVPKGAREPVWEEEIRCHVPHFLFPDSNLIIFNHTDLLRKAGSERDYPAWIQHVRERYDAIVIDEAHHFRNPGVRGENEEERRSRYWQLFDMAEGKDLFMLTATPINNHLRDLQHMIELFSRRKRDYFSNPPLGIHSLPGHFRKMEKELDRRIEARDDAGDGGDGAETNQVEAEEVLSDDSLFRALVVQRSRAFVKKSQAQESADGALFPTREAPRVVDYDLKTTYGPLLQMVEKAFGKQKPLFSLAIYYPLAYYKGPDTSIDPMKEGRQRQVTSLIRIQFLKRFESSARAFEASCCNLLVKLLAWVERHSFSDSDKRRLERWKSQHSGLLDYVNSRRHEFSEDEEAEEDVVSPEMLEKVEELEPAEFKVDEILEESYNDMDQAASFIEKTRQFNVSHDDKLAQLVKLVRTDPVLKQHKVLIFTEFMDTARYLKQQLDAAGITGVDEVDGDVKRDRGEIIKRFSPYYNGSSTAELADRGIEETRILISTDVLSEGLNLQDATRLINYDLHWNPVRLMQRIGRVDRRLNRDIEKRMLADHPDRRDIRGTVAFWNFLPPGELEHLLRLYKRVAKKTLRISKTFGIEGRKLLKPDDDYDALREFNRKYEGDTTPYEDLHLEYHRMLKADTSLLDRLESQPDRVFSGKKHPRADSRAVFFCYVMPDTVKDESGELHWREGAGDARWYVFNLETEEIIEDPAAIAEFIRSKPDTPRKCAIERSALSQIRVKIEKHIRNTHLKSIQAPAGVRPVLKTWMELN